MKRSESCRWTEGEKAKLEKLLEMLRESNYTVVFTGAGVSTDSGLSDFRSQVKGLYNRENSYGLPADQIMSEEFYKSHPEIFFDFYRKELLDLSASPNMIHETLAAMEREGYVFCIITQNGDNLHQRAGSKNVLDIHGNVYRNTCEKCGKEFEAAWVSEYNGVPRCSCGGIVRPGVVLFGQIPDGRVVYSCVKEINNAELVLVLGSSLRVSTASRLLGRYRGKLVIINDMPTPVDGRAQLVINSRLDRVFSYLKDKLLKEDVEYESDPA